MLAMAPKMEKQTQRRGLLKELKTLKATVKQQQDDIHASAAEDCTGCRLKEGALFWLGTKFSLLHSSLWVFPGRMYCCARRAVERLPPETHSDSEESEQQESNASRVLRAYSRLIIGLYRLRKLQRLFNNIGNHLQTFPKSIRDQVSRHLPLQ
jgi:hypothetical protein